MEDLKLNIKPQDLVSIKCENCNNDLYRSAFKFKKVSKLLTGSPKDQIIPIEIFVCTGCGEMLKELMPKELIDG